ncbi:hypothetical protein ACHAQH_000120 [Verticillium albo-atrum]
MKGSFDVSPLRVGLRHLKDAYGEAQAQWKEVVDKFDTATDSIKLFAGSKAICQLWHDFLREQRRLGVDIDAALNSVQYCLLNLKQQRDRVALPKPFDKLVRRAVKVGQEIMELSDDAKADRRAADRLILAMQTTAADVDPEADANYRLLLDADTSHKQSTQDEVPSDS